MTTTAFGSDSLRTLGLVSYPRDGQLALTNAGAQAAPPPDLTADFHERLRSTLTNPQQAVFDCLLRADEPKTRELLARQVGWEPTSGHLKNVLGSLRTLQLVDYPEQGVVDLQAWVRAGVGGTGRN